jgi:3'(2'), 5'-bisphosphate nucleotidase
MAKENIVPDAGRLLKPVIALARVAGERIMEIYGQDFSVREKEDKSPLTEADMASHHVIVDGLADLAPGIPVLSEESVSLPYSVRSAWQCYWLVDPLDGTREFIKHNGEFTVNIALIDNGVPVLGVVYVPVTGLTYYAGRGVGAFRQAQGGEARPITVNKPCQTPLKVVGSRSHRGDSLNRFLENAGDYEMIGMGSSLKLCLVADGSADIYPRFGPTSEWDTAAAQCVVEQAGGQVTNTAMEPLRYNTRDSLLNPHFLVFGDAERNWSALL